jgi:hypothetical protein
MPGLMGMLPAGSSIHDGTFPFVCPPVSDVNVALSENGTECLLLNENMSILSVYILRAEGLEAVHDR